MCTTPEGHIKDAPEGEQDDAEAGDEHTPAQASRPRRSPPPALRPRHIHNRMQELDDAQLAIKKEWADLQATTHGPAQPRARDVRRRILNDEEAPAEPQAFGRASQNLVAVTLLLRSCPEPEALEARRIHQWLRTLLEEAAV